MKNYSLWLKNNKDILETIYNFAGLNKVNLYLVGGVIRDVYLNRVKQNLDFDFCLENGAIEFARKLANHLKAGFVVLDEVNKCGRVVKKTENGFITFDFADFRGKDIKEDLLHRDFTINSMAIALEDIINGKQFEDALVDPYHGIKDLETKIVRMTNLSAFDEDVLRIMRAFSMAALFDMKIEQNTLKLVKIKAKKIKTVSTERIRDELFKIFSVQDSHKYIRDLEKAGILEIILPEIKAMRKPKNSKKLYLDVLKHSFETLEYFEKIIADFKSDKNIKSYFERIVSYDRSLLSAVKLAILLHDVGKPATYKEEKSKVTFYGHERVGAAIITKIGERLKLSNDEVRILRRLTFFHLRPGYLVTNPVLTARAKFRFFRDADKDAVAVLLLALADQRATKGYALVEKSRKRFEKIISVLVKEYFKEVIVKPKQKLFDGNDLMKYLHLKPSVLIGQLLKELEELYAIGKIKTKDDAMLQAQKILAKSK